MEVCHCSIIFFYFLLTSFFVFFHVSFRPKCARAFMRRAYADKAHLFFLDCPRVCVLQAKCKVKPANHTLFFHVRESVRSAAVLPIRRTISICSCLRCRCTASRFFDICIDFRKQRLNVKTRKTKAFSHWHNLRASCLLLRVSPLDLRHKRIRRRNCPGPT